MLSFLQTQIGNVTSASADSTSGTESNLGKPAEKFIIVETNFRVYAYTTNNIYKEILKLFV